jgi:hypothetical protein
MIRRRFRPWLAARDAVLIVAALTIPFMIVFHVHN